MKTFFCILTSIVFLLSCSVEAQNLKLKSSNQGYSAQEKENLAVAKRFVNDFLGQGNLGIAEEVLDDQVRVSTGLSPQGPIEGLANYKNVLGDFFDAFPAESMVIEDIFASDDRVALRFNCLTTFQKDYFGITATQKPMRFIETHVMRLRDGKIIENVVSATNLQFEMVFAPVLSPMILGDDK